MDAPPTSTGWGQVSGKDEDIARQAMRQTNTLQFAARYIGEVSGGEQQRLLLARALTQSAPILLLDEPTAHLDLQHQLTLLKMVQQLARECDAGRADHPARSQPRLALCRQGSAAQ